MIVIDENIVRGQRERLFDLKVHFSQIGFEIGWSGMKDHNDVIPLLHTLSCPTFFTSDMDFYKTGLRHAEYCLVFLDIPADETAEYMCRLLRHPSFRTKAQRMSKVVRVRPTGMSWWEVGGESEHVSSW